MPVALRSTLTLVLPTHRRGNRPALLGFLIVSGTLVLAKAGPAAFSIRLGERENLLELLFGSLR
jgi:hypothetical protein